MKTPDDIRYTAEHEWARQTDSGTLRVGITDHAQQSLGDIVYISLPAVGADVTAGSALGEVESTKSVSDIYSPVTGKISARNEALETQPELVNSDPYGEGWIVEIESSDSTALERLLSAAAYRDLVEK